MMRPSLLTLDAGARVARVALRLVVDAYRVALGMPVRGFVHVALLAASRSDAEFTDVLTAIIQDPGARAAADGLHGSYSVLRAREREKHSRAARAVAEKRCVN